MLNQLRDYISQLESLLVCYSGGTDSALLLYLAANMLGKRAHGLFFDAAMIPEQDKADAIKTAAAMKADIIVKKVDIFAIPELGTNPENRCYICKRNLLTLARAEAYKLGFSNIAEGSHADDLNEHRPGRVAIKELGILSPFEACGIGKADIRRISKELGLDTWNKASYSCLLTRLPHDEPVLGANLRKVEALEYFMRQLGFVNFRVRHRGAAVLVEVISAERELLMEHQGAIERVFHEYGYSEISYTRR